jgi:lysine 2,3-aminomutase
LFDYVADVRAGVSQADWDSWQWQMANRLRTPDQLTRLLGLAPLQALKYKSLIDTFHYAITPYYLSLINWRDPKDPIRLQSVPDLRELDSSVVSNDDPLEEEQDMQVPGLVHRYPDRVLAIVTGTCSMYCRHCTRKRIWNEGEWTRSRKELAAMVTYVKRTKKVREVVVSGGDPLLMNLDTLDWFLGELGRIPHVEVVRIGTRVPVVLPMRITDELVQMLRTHRPLWINTQFNHAREITPESAAACDRLLSVGIPVSNQSVLLRGVNDTTEAMTALSHALQRIMVRPYYLYQCDPVVGVEHFRTNVFKGIQIIEEMRGHTGGLCIPNFVVDAPGGGGKIPLQPFYLLSVGEQEIMLRNYEGMIIKYYNPREEDGKPPARSRKSKKPVSGIYCDNSRQIRRHKKGIVDVTRQQPGQLLDATPVAPAPSAPALVPPLALVTPITPLQPVAPAREGGR